ncbi:hypothetical protein IFM89_027515 [Coptis chinensis]|uniref:Uncharacterized protein n=1 Tax=Coptis chinensis TaxID=261450 RepID=A0A835M584_9MAGN|nr:hypothetical protein IFM89_027515 [Coptis chinensis]
MNDSSVVEEEEEKFISRFVSEIEGNCMAITGLDGNRVYAKMTSNVEMNDSSTKKLNIKGYANGLISEPISVLMDKMDQEALAKALQDSSESPNEVTHHETPGVSEKLWVEKYAPNSFTELLSDEQTNREVLLWLKQWDSGVFGSDIRSTKDDVLSSLRRHSTVTHHKKLSDTSFNSKNRRFPYPYKASVSNNLAQESSNFESNHGIWKKTLKGAGPPDHKDLLGRAGYLDLVLKIIQVMPVQAQTQVWVPLLSACRTHRNVQLGELVAKREVEAGCNGEKFDGRERISEGAWLEPD